MKRLTSVIALAAAAIFAGQARAAVTLGFQHITNNNVADATIGEAQLFVEVADEGSGQVSFRFFNTGPAASSITDLYFDDGVLNDLISIDDSGSGVSFSEGAAPPDLPGGDSIVPQFNASFSADSDAPPPINGVNPGEEVTVFFSLDGGNSFTDLLDDIAAGDLRVGIHVQAFASGGSESFINDPGPIDPIPEPGSLVVWSLLGVAGIAYRRRRSRKVA